MNIVQVREMFKDASYKGAIDKLVQLYEKSEDCSMNGYLGSGVKNISRDDLGKLEFESYKNVGDLETISTGVVLEDGFAIKQIQKNDTNTYFQVFSWNSDANKYTWVEFDNNEAMDYAFTRLKIFDTNLCDCDISEKLHQLGINLDDIAQVLTDKKIDFFEDRNISELHDMIEDANRKDEENGKEDALSISLL